MVLHVEDHPHHGRIPGRRLRTHLRADLALRPEDERTTGPHKNQPREPIATTHRRLNSFKCASTNRRNSDDRARRSGSASGDSSGSGNASASRTAQAPLPRSIARMTGRASRTAAASPFLCRRRRASRSPWHVTHSPIATPRRQRHARRSAESERGPRSPQAVRHQEPCACTGVRRKRYAYGSQHRARLLGRTCHYGLSPRRLARLPYATAGHLWHSIGCGPAGPGCNLYLRCVHPSSRGRPAPTRGGAIPTKAE